MRLALVSLIALTAAAANAVAQPATTTPAAPAPAASPPASPPPASPPAPPAPASPTTPPPAATAPMSPPAPTTPPTAAPETPPPAAEAPVAEAPPAPPPPPTDPTAIAVLSVLTNVCIPAANGGNLAQLAKTAGFRKTSDTWTLRQSAYTVVIESPGTNPNQCHMDITHPVDLEAPGRPIVVALHNWAEFANGWTLYRNDKSVQAGFEYTTRSWQKDADGKAEALAFTTQRHPDGTPMQRSNDTSQLIYSQNKDPS